MLCPGRRVILPGFLPHRVVRANLFSGNRGRPRGMSSSPLASTTLVLAVEGILGPRGVRRFPA